MNLVSWMPKITARGVGATYVIDPALHFAAVLRCPVCGHEETVETSGHLVNNQELAPLSMNIRWEFDDLTKQRACTECGTVSDVPKADRLRLQHNIPSVVTLGWVEQQVEALKNSAKKVA